MMSLPQRQPSSLFELQFPQSVGIYNSYADAQKAVDYLSDEKFEVQNLAIVGTELKSVERVLGRRNWGTVITQGLQSGISTGLLVGLVVLIFTKPTSYFVLLLVSGVLAGTGPRASFSPPPVLVAAIPVVVMLLLGLLAVRRIRAFVLSRVVPPIKAAIPQVIAVVQTLAKLAQLLGGALLLDASFVAALVCATRAFGAETSIPATAVVYFAGAIIGSAVPTPGGLGGIEAAMSAGLIAIGVDSGTAVSSVLLYRLATYWLPIPFGWFSLNHLQRIHAL